MNTAVIVCIARCRTKSRLYFILLHMAIAGFVIKMILRCVNFANTNGTVDIVLYWSNKMWYIIINQYIIFILLQFKQKNNNLFFVDLLLGLTDTVIHGIEKTNGYIYFDVIGYYLIFIQSSALCALQRGFSNACQLASNFILCAASLDRALVVAKPMMNFRRG